MLTLLATFATVSFLATVMPGPDTAVVVKHSIRGGRRAALFTAAGCSIGQLSWGLVSIAGIGVLLAHSVVAFTIVKYVGAAYLLAIGLHTLWASRSKAGRADPDHDSPSGPTAGRHPLRDGLLVNALNPKTALFMSALLPQFVSAGSPPWLPFLLVIMTAGISWAWMSFYAVVFARLAGYLRRPAVRRAMDRVIGTVLVGLGVRLAAERA